MKVLVLGGSGMLGHKLVQVLGSRFEVYSTVRGPGPQISEMGLIDPEKVFLSVNGSEYETVERVLLELEPAVVVNAIGVTKQKSGLNDSIRNIEINSLLPHKIAQTAARIDARTITFSTDCVFSGRRGNYTEDDTADAEDLYGRSKTLGELDGPLCLTLRTSIIGRELSGSHGLAEWLISNRGAAATGFSKAVFSGLTTLELAKLVGDIIETEPELNGVYHVSGPPINKYELLLLIDRCFGLGISIDRDESFEIDRSLDSSRFRKATNFEPKSWENMIDDMALDAAKYPEWRKLKF